MNVALDVGQRPPELSDPRTAGVRALPRIRRPTLTHMRATGRRAKQPTAAASSPAHGLDLNRPGFVAEKLIN